MFGFGKKDKKADPGAAATVPDNARRGLFSRLRDGLAKTRQRLGGGLADLLGGRTELDADLRDELEGLLLSADVGLEASDRILDAVQERVSRRQSGDSEALTQALRESMLELLTPRAEPLRIDAANKPFVILTVGVNGAGKTTTIGKLAAQLKGSGKSVVLAAGDTFRAAAVEQLVTWGERVDVPVIRQQQGADSASVLYDALAHAQARGADVLIADTAGRLHTQDNLVEELKKIRRVLGKLDEQAPHEVLLVLDAGTGQNALAQAREFQKAVEVTGIALTKLDGTAKGGIIFAIAENLGLPIRMIGVGESVEDLRDFEPEAFVDALLSR